MFHCLIKIQAWRIELKLFAIRNSNRIIMQQLFILISNPKVLRTILSVDVLDYTSSAI